MSVRLAKLVTGEEVIAEITMDKGVYTFKNPVRIVMARDGMGIVPWSPFISEQSVKVAHTHVLFTAELDQEIENGYNAKFGNGIVIANQMPPEGGLQIEV